MYLLGEVGTQGRIRAAAAERKIGIQEVCQTPGRIHFLTLQQKALLLSLVCCIAVPACALRLISGLYISWKLPKSPAPDHEPRAAHSSW